MAEKFRQNGQRKLSRSASSLENGSVFGSLVGMLRGCFAPPAVTFIVALTFVSLDLLLVRAGHHTIQGRRESQEDAHSIKLTNDYRLDDTTTGYGFVSVFDGHGGVLAADFCAKHFGSTLAKEVKADAGDFEHSVSRTLELLEEAFMSMARKEELLDGTTACVVVLNDQKELIHGNVGDSEAVLGRFGENEEIEAVALSEIHNPAKNDSEIDRIKAAGGKLFGKRLCHAALAPQFCSISVSRSIGDLLFKDKTYTRRENTALISTPFVCKRTIEECDVFVIVACDGIWDSLEHQEAVEIVYKELKESKDANHAAEKLVEAAFAKGSTDNCTAIVLVLKNGF